MSLKPKHRLSGKTALDLTDYNDDFISNKNTNIHLDNTYRQYIIRQIRWKQILIIYLVYLSIIHYFERTKPYYTFKSCLWNNWESWPNNSEPHHSIIIGDPQIVDEFSYPSRNWIELGFTKLLSDNYLHRNHKIYNQVLNPDSIIFIGDLFDGGREWNDTQWLNEYVRFNKIFNPIPGVRQFRQIPGNHDVGFGNGIDFDKYSRFKSYFGNADEVYILGNHSIVLMDTVSLSCTDDDKINAVSDQFLAAFEDDFNPYKKYPRIVFSHVPLYRFNELQTCGPLRESSKPFPVSRGNQYQTVLEYDLSQKILNWIRPIMLFSGDDHDYCHIRHPLDKSFSSDKDDYHFQRGDHPGLKYTDEVTVKSSAMTGGIKKPAIQLLSLWNPRNENDDSWDIINSESNTVDSETASTHLCYLPSPYQPLVHYGIILCLSVWWIFICTVSINFGHRLNGTFQRYAFRLKRTIEKMFKKDIQSIDMTYLEAKRTNGFEKYLFKIFFEWDVEHQKNWTAFAVNTFLVVGLLLLTVFWYIVSI